jgi:hypothetical protein
VIARQTGFGALAIGFPGSQYGPAIVVGGWDIATGVKW